MAISLPPTQTLYASAARTATPTFHEPIRIQGDAYRGVLVEIDCTAIAATPSVVFTIESQAGAGWITDLASAAVTATGTTVLVVHPDVTDVTNLAESSAMLPIWRVSAVHADADSITYSVIAIPLP